MFETQTVLAQLSFVYELHLKINTKGIAVV